jgi:hypothetical protein
MMPAPKSSGDAPGAKPDDAADEAAPKATEPAPAKKKGVLILDKAAAT